MLENKDAPRELNRLEVLRGLRIATWEASFATVWMSLTTGAFLTGYALWIGANDLAISLLTAIPTFAGLTQLVSSYFGERLEERRKFTAWFSVLARTLWLPILLLPFFFPRAATLYPFLILFTLSYVFINVPLPAYMSWMSDLVPPDHRGRYFGRRNMIAGLVGMLVGLPAAWFLDFATRRHHWEPFGFGTLFGVAVAGGLASFVCLLRQPEPVKRALPVADRENGLKGVLSYYRAPFADPNFRRMMLFNMVFGTGQFFAAPFFGVYSLKVLQLNYTLLQIFATLTSIAALLTMPVWGYLADKFGNKPLLSISVVGVSTLPFMWIPTTHDNLLLTIVIVGIGAGIGGGIFWSGAGLAQFNLLIRLSPSDKTPIYVATMSAVTGLTGGLAPLVGGVVMRLLDGWSYPLFGWTITNYHVTFAIAGTLRLISLFWLQKVEDVQSVSARAVLKQLGQANPRDWLHIRQLQSGAGEGTKLKATEALAESRSQLALTELKLALHDPSQAVRQEAAHALGEIGAMEAVESLIAALTDPMAGLTCEAATALGRIGDVRAVPYLMAIFREETTLLGDRVSILEALGVLGGEEVEAELIEILNVAISEGKTSEQIAIAAVKALGRSANEAGCACLGIHMQNPMLAREVRLALINSLGQIGKAESREPLRKALDFSDPGYILLPFLADAFVRTDEMAIPLLQRIPLLDSSIGRKQVAAAVGTLMGQGENVYSLLALEEFARDTAISKLLQELARRHKSLEITDAMRQVEDAYIAGNYDTAVRKLFEVETVSEREELSDEIRSESSHTQLCKEVLNEVAACREGNPPVETMLLAMIAFRARVE